MSYGDGQTSELPNVAPVERWKRVNRFSGYEVSNLARVRNRRTGRFLKPYLNSHEDGERYLRLTLVNRRGRRQQFYLHRLVALYHVPGRSRRRCHVHHERQPPELVENNWAIYLRWLTPAENIALKYGPIERLGSDPLVEAPF